MPFSGWLRAIKYLFILAFCAYSGHSLVITTLPARLWHGLPWLTDRPLVDHDGSRSSSKLVFGSGSGSLVPHMNGSYLNKVCLRRTTIIGGLLHLLPSLEVGGQCSANLESTNTETYRSTQHFLHYTDCLIFILLTGNPRYVIPVASIRK
jgi:hypothetical protein